MKGKQGFTLLELLIAAAIIGVLAIFATQSFRRSAADIRVEDATVRAKLVLAAAKRFVQDNPSSTFEPLDKAEVIMGPRVRSSCDANKLSVQNLIHCGYLEYRQYVADGREGDKYKSNFSMEITANTSVKTVSVCIKGTSKKITDYYSGHCETEHY